MLGTSSAAPTRERNHVSAVLRWGHHKFAFDPGEGTQRQLLLADLSSYKLTHVCITHFHGDHCLGLSGIVQRRALQHPPTPLVIYYPSWGQAYIDRLLTGTEIDFDLQVELVPVEPGDRIAVDPELELWCEELEHSVPTVGWRLQAAPRRHLLPERLAALGISGADIGRLRDEGSIEVAGRRVTFEEMSEVRPDASFAWVLDTRPCPGAERLAAGATMLVSESTYLDDEREMAHDHGHTTAREAGELAARAGAGSLVLTHYSERYGDRHVLEAEARTAFPGAIAAEDLQRIPVPAAP